MKDVVEIQVMIVENEVFALRNGERQTITDQLPVSGCRFAIMARSCWFPDGPTQPTRQSDGAKVESAAIITCQQVDGKWQWMQLSAITKERLGDLLFDSGADKDKWYYVVIEPALEAV